MESRFRVYFAFLNLLIKTLMQWCLFVIIFFYIIFVPYPEGFPVLIDPVSLLTPRSARSFRGSGDFTDATSETMRTKSRSQETGAETQDKIIPASSTKFTLPGVFSRKVPANIMIFLFRHIYQLNGMMFNKPPLACPVGIFNL